ncbi:MAG: NAD(P)/FAD-dependent oxidoreductase [Candidatus Rifleibacteriota bacterium]
MKVIIRQIEVSLDYREEDVLSAIAKKLRCNEKDIKSFNIFRRSLDARPRRSAPVYVLQAEANISDKVKSNALRNKDVEMASQNFQPDFKIPHLTRPHDPPVIIGAGPAGLMAAYHLAAMGLKPVLIERGCKTEDRKPLVEKFWRNGKFDPECNVLYGEGGAGLFSDGKLTARSKDKARIRLFFETLVECGAPKDILIDAEPHLGSDKLLEIVPNLREKILGKGGEIIYNTRLEHILFDGNQINSIIAGGRKFRTNRLILATGHSARDIYQLLAEANVKLEAKPFAVGIRLEIPQAQINKAQYGEFSGHPKLQAASFRLTRRPEGGARACYSFCMCPGGLVISCASEAGGLTTNGMSYSARNGFYGNAAFIVPINPEDFSVFARQNPYSELAGIKFQQEIERAAFKKGGGNFSVPALRLEDFLNDRISVDLPGNRSCKMSTPADFREILPEFVIKTLKIAIPKMLAELNGCNPADAIVYAAETRSSSPIRIVRNELCQSISHNEIYPAGEGSGYAGGIVSSAVDGIKAAEMLVESLT